MPLVWIMLLLVGGSWFMLDAPNTFVYVSMVRDLRVGHRGCNVVTAVSIQPGNPEPFAHSSLKPRNLDDSRSDDCIAK